MITLAYDNAWSSIFRNPAPPSFSLQLFGRAVFVSRKF